MACLHIPSAYNLETKMTRNLKARRGIVGGFADYLDEKDIAWLNRKIQHELSPFYGYQV